MHVAHKISSSIIWSISQVSVASSRYKNGKKIGFILPWTRFYIQSVGYRETNSIKYAFIVLFCTFNVFFYDTCLSRIYLNIRQYKSLYTSTYFLFFMHGNWCRIKSFRYFSALLFVFFLEQKRFFVVCFCFRKIETFFVFRCLQIFFFFCIMLILIGSASWTIE